MRHLTSTTFPRRRVVLFCAVLTTHFAILVGLNNSLPLLDTGDVVVANFTDTTVLLSWKAKYDLNSPQFDDYRFTVEYQRQGSNRVLIEAFNYDPDCSLRLSYCRLKGLVPGSLYSVTLTISSRANNTWLAGARLPIRTLSETDEMNNRTWQWWALYVGAPSAGGCLVIVITLICARCCGCCCWKKRAAGDITPSRSSTSRRSCPRPESHATKQWAETTFRTIEMDPPSTYDQPGAPPIVPPTSPGSKHSYVQMYETPVSKPLASPQRGGDGRNSRPSESSSTGQIPASSPSYLNQLESPKTRQNSASDSPRKHMVKLPLSTDKPNAQLGRPQQAQTNPVRSEECPLYTNTEDLDQLLGSARKMFPSLKSA